MSEQSKNVNGENMVNDLEAIFAHSAVPTVDLGGASFEQMPAGTMQQQVEMQQAVPQQAVPQQVPPQTVPQQVPPQTVPQQVPPQTVPQQVPPQTVPQQVPPQTVPQQVPSQAVPQQVKSLQTHEQSQSEGKVVDLFGAVVEESQENDLNTLLALLTNKAPMFEYGSISDEIADATITFEQLRIKMSADCPELEARAHVSWSMVYAGITERITNVDATIYEVKNKIEKSKKFKDALKKRKQSDKEPVCAVKPTVTAQKKGVLELPSYKGIYSNTDQALASGKAIAYIPAKDGNMYEIRKNEIGTFIAPASYISELEEIGAGFQMSLPRLPAHYLSQIIAFFREVCIHYKRNVEALVNVLWDREDQRYILHIPSQHIDCASVQTDLHEQPDTERYLHVMDIHSHNTMAARFSKIDDRDEQATRLYMVIGRLDKFYPEICCRFACGGYHVEIPVEQICEREEASFSADWIKAVSTDKVEEAM